MRISWSGSNCYQGPLGTIWIDFHTVNGQESLMKFCNMYMYAGEEVLTLQIIMPSMHFQSKFGVQMSMVDRFPDSKHTRHPNVTSNFLLKMVLGES